MSKFPVKIFMAILLSPALTTPLAAMEKDTSVKSQISKSLEIALDTIQGTDTKKSQLDADAKEKQAVESSLTNAEQIAKSASNRNEITQATLITPLQPIVNSEISNLMSMEQFKVCSLGHDYNISDFEFIKQSEVTQAATIMKFTAGSNPNYKCEMMVLSESKNDVNLKCWHGSKFKESVSNFKLRYFFDQGFLFSQSGNAKMILIKPILNSEENTCPNNFKPVASSQSSSAPTADEEKEGLAGLTF